MSKSILLIDDDPNICETAADILEAAGYGVKMASTGALALDELSQASVDLILMDFNLPDTTAKELAPQIRAAFPLLKMIVLSGEQEPPLGASRDLIHQVLTKPVSPSELVGLIKQLLD
jgi:DNA-binding response OmpR family regulator